MKGSNIDFNRISQAINYSIEVLKGEESPSSSSALDQLINAQDELNQALSFSLSSNLK
ncbi:hypothetical protein ACFYKX_16390 [Cytobacillus sp. FJAT-54145]|uniref:Uncharacterized protein n=1 Tax=Cytobacillus spartinae TaxID=3299023 RepID=A0ABW6KD66_9BACI